MKLKEKLAQNYLISTGLSCDDQEIQKMLKFVVGKTFVDGFNKAREMAARIAYSPKFDGTGDEIDTLGEEEV